ncbi:PREDICTED: uncharacterized protein LOC108561473 [Nicrophorus vespilloides]|uniref:Uncharacterized protein LOC108561473 n=1 Tax=Nicrophorus vespilloides TaxID=110193 RepID=A0ABM1MK09_NICVS|nr:PREDICTED: uncharacterized protein LOC108561473 [Nicrophorus vespilloides]
MTKDWDVDLMPRKKYSWGSVLEDVRLRRSDLATCGHWMWRVTQLNIEAVQYMQGCATYLVPKPTVIATTIFDPFSLCIWILIAILTQIVSFILYLTQKYIVGINRNYSYCFLEVFRILALNPMTNFPTHRNLKFILVLWYSTALQLSIAFSAGFTSTLTHEKYTNPVDNIKDIVYNDVACYDVGTSLSSWLKYSDNVFVKMLAKTIISNHTMENLPDDACLGANVIRRFVVPEISDIREDIKDKIKLISECVGEFFLTFALQKNSPYSEFVDRKIRMFQEHGLTEVWFKYAIYQDYNYWQKMSQYVMPRTSIIRKKLNYDQMEGAFYVLLVGLLTAFAAFIIESFN